MILKKKEIISFTQRRIFKVREKTLQLISNLEPEDLVIQTEDYVSPIKWHLGHTTWFLKSFYLLLTLKITNYLIRTLIIFLILIMRVLEILIQNLREAI